MTAPSAASVQSVLVEAQTALAEGQLRQAQRSAETLLQIRLPVELRAAALLVAADAAYGMRSYRQAAKRYGEFLSNHDQRPEAPRAAVALGWAQLRQGERDRARRSWMQTADRFPADPRAPLALLLAAEVANQAADVKAANALLGRVIGQYPTTLPAGTARLSRAILSLRGHRDDEAVRDLDEAIRSYGATVVDHRRRTIEALAVAGSEAALETAGAAEPIAASAETAIERFAAAFLQAGDRVNAPYVLHGLSLVVATDHGWSDAAVATLVQRLVEHSPSYPAAPALLARVAAAAVSAGQWPIARRAYEALVSRYPGSALSAAARVDLAEVLIRVGAESEARVQLAEAAAVGGDDRPRALLLLAGVEEALGHREAARAAYDRLLREHPVPRGSATDLLLHARLLEAFGQPDRARPLLQQIVAASDEEVVSEAAYRLGRMLAAEGQHAAAVEWQLTAAYLAETSSWARQALLDAGRSLTALQRADEALIVYRKLMPKAFARQASDDAISPSALVRVDQPQAREVIGEAAYRIAEILRGRGDHEAALDMYLTAANLTVDASAARRALLGAMRSVVMMRNPAAAEAMYRRVLESRESDPALLAEARRTLSGRGDTGLGAGAALPGSVRD